MSDSTFNETLEDCKREFLLGLESKISSLEEKIKAMDGKTKSSIDMSELSSIIRELHNIKSVGGTYEVDFLVSAVRNFIDYSSSIYDLSDNDVVDVGLCLKIIDLIKLFLRDIQSSESGVLSGELDAILKDKDSQKRVLLVEKDEKIIHHFKMLFKKFDLSYALVTSGVDAFSRLLDEKFDLLITDLHIGKLDGPSLIAANRVARGQNKDIQTLMLSVSYFDLLPSISVPDVFLSKDDKLLNELDEFFKKFVINEATTNICEDIDILCLDDDQNIHDLLKITFRNHNIKYRSSVNSKDFFEQYSHKKPDIVILDLILERESGVDAIKRIKSEGLTFDVPVIVLSSLEGGLRAELLSEVPFIIGTLSKPFTPKSMGKEVISLYQRNRRSVFTK